MTAVSAGRSGGRRRLLAVLRLALAALLGYGIAALQPLVFSSAPGGRPGRDQRPFHGNCQGDC